MGLRKELEGVFARLSSEHDVIPFMTQMLRVGEADFRPLPADMLEVLRSSADYQSVRPGERPTWFQVAAGNDALELVIYRAETDGHHYVLAPKDGVKD